MPICKVEIHTERYKAKGYPKEITNLGEAIKGKRLDMKLTKVELAKLLKVSPLTIGTWENSNKIPVPRLLQRIISWLGYIPPLGVDKNTLGGQLYTYRCKHGLTQKDVASALGIDKWIITKIENNIEIEVKYLEKIKSGLNL